MFPIQLTLGFFKWLFVGIALFSAVGSVAVGQTMSNTDGSTPLSLTPGAPAGSFALSGFDNVNLFNGNLNFQLPLLNIGGRGSAQMRMTLTLEQKWRVESIYVDQSGDTMYFANHNWWSGVRPGYGPGVLLGRITYLITPYCDPNSTAGAGTLLSRLTFTGPDGTEYELRDQATGGRPMDVNPCVQWGANRGQIFTSADGTAMTFVSDTAIYDNAWSQGEYNSVFYPSGYLMLRDGTRYRIEGGLVKWIRDRNGNKLTFAYDNHGEPYGPANRVISITDSLNREVTISYDVQDVQPFGLCDKIEYRGFGGAVRTIRVSKTNLGNALRSDFTRSSYYQLFPELNGSSNGATGLFDPVVISAVWLPDGRFYTFSYNSYAELSRVKLPTGGAFEYDYAAGLINGPPSGAWLQGFASSSSQADSIYRRIVEKRTYSADNTVLSKTRFSRPESIYTCGAGVCVQTEGSVAADDLDPNGVLLTKTKHYYFGNAARVPDVVAINGYWPWRSGREYKTESIDANGVAVLRRITQTWAQRAPVPWWSPSAPLSEDQPPNDPRVTESQTELTDTTPTLISKQTFGYDDSVPYNNRNDVEEYDFGSGAPGPLIRRTHTEYVTSMSYTDAATGAHLRNLPERVSVYEGNIERARTTLEYDNYGTGDSYHSPLQTYPRSGFNELPISGLDSAYASQTSNLTRGNATARTRWLFNSSGAVIGSVTAYTQYDIAGNVVRSIDPRSTPTNVIATSFDFADRFGSPDGEARANSGSAELNTAGQNGYAFPTLVTNALGHTAYAQFDYYLGRAVDGEDANGVVASGFFNDLLDRPTQVIRAASDFSNPSTKSQTTFDYNDADRVITTTTDLNALNDNLLKSQILYDGLGRTIESRQYEGGSNYIAVQTQYDALGRAFKTSNPFRPWQSESAVWTTRAFDALGRVTSITTPDNAVVSTAYSGDRVLVTDQAWKQRISKSNALGQLKDVWEVRSTDAETETISFPNHPEVTAGYRTSYTYDALDNLTTVSQGSQTRTFAYDSLKRLLSASNPESGTICYGTVVSNQCQADGYDANGNLLFKTDARLVRTTFAYDALNRAINRSYQNDPANTPVVSYVYDTATNGKGRLTSVSSSVSSYSYSGYDAMGRVTGATQSIGGQTYTITEVAYDLAGHLKTMKYPSGRTITNTFDNAGRLSSFAGNLGDGGAPRTYANEFEYTSLNGLQQEKFGTQTAIYHKQRFNLRGQLWDMRASTVPFATDPANGDRGAIVNYYSSNFVQGGSGSDNNGNLLRQEHHIPGSSFFQDSFDYDQLNRLKSINERLNGTGTPTFTQNYSYDRWGNRTISGVTGTGINNLAFEVENGTNGTNRLYAPGDLALPETSRQMQYDPAGNLKKDTYSGAAVTRLYDAENKMTKETQAGSVDAGIYSYDGDGQRVMRKVNGVETWQVYGLSGELIAEYAATNPNPLTPQKEYGYRNGELLITATAATAGWGAPPTIDDNPLNDPQNPESQKIKAIHITQLRAAINALRAHHSLPNYQWVKPTISNGAIDSSVFISWEPIDEMRTALNEALGPPPPPGYTPGLAATQPILAAHIQELRNRVLAAWQSSGSAADIRWLVTDHLGTPRMIFDQTGSLQNVSRHDYLPFGEELFAGTGGRTTAQGYTASDNVRQKFTQKERDNETGLDYFDARYYSAMQGRFSSTDPYSIISEIQFEDSERANRKRDAYIGQPQNWNRYVYVRNNPLKYIDPTGEHIELTGTEEEKKAAFERIKRMVGKDGAQYLRTVEMCANGRCGTYVTYNGSTMQTREKFAATGGLNGYFARMIDSEKTTEYRIATSFDTKFEKGRLTSSLNCGGGCTVGAEESLTGNTQIFVHPDAGNVTDDIFNRYINAHKIDPPGHRLDFYDDIVDAHEFGHAYSNMIDGAPIRNSGATNARSLEFENWQRSNRYPGNKARRRLH